MSNDAIPALKSQVDGVLLLDKPVGVTSQQAVAQAKRLFSAAKAGHTGTLDPMASGLLPICLGEATKFSHLLLDADKRYVATITLGLTTSTGDAEGIVVTTASVDASRRSVERTLTRFVGDLLQTPPMFSAIKHAGKPLYRYARAGVSITREPRRVSIYRLELEDFDRNELRIAVHCSKGTYVRVLAEDIGRALGCGACLSALRRTGIGTFGINDAVTLAGLAAQESRAACLKPVDTLVRGLPRIDLDALQAQRLRSGVAVGGADRVARGLVRIYGPGERYLGVALVDAEGAVTARRLIASDTPASSGRALRSAPDIA